MTMKSRSPFSYKCDTYHLTIPSLVPGAPVRTIHYSPPITYHLHEVTYRGRVIGYIELSMSRYEPWQIIYLSEDHTVMTGRGGKFMNRDQAAWQLMKEGNIAAF